jgi:hypothetical protein
MKAKTVEKYFEQYGIRYFKEFPEEIKCPICETSDNDYCVLIGMDGTGDGHIEEAKAVHVHCLLKSENLRINSKVQVLYQRVNLSGVVTPDNE